MKSYHIHINGRVQGVGFRPCVHKLAEQMDVKGWISNSNDGVHVEFTADDSTAMQFYQTIIQSPPSHSIITRHHITEIPLRNFLSFTISNSTTENAPDLLMTPDLAICEKCKKEALTNSNRWSHYPFTTCLH